MAGADQGDNSGLPANGDKVPVDGADARDAEAGSAAAGNAEAVSAEAGNAEASSQSAERAVTQLLPVIAPEAADIPKVRAVARRSAAALPAIGRPTVASAVPKSARATVDRRKLAAQADADTPATPTSDTPATPIDAEQAAAKPGAVPVPIQTAAKPAAVPVPEQTAAKPVPVPVPEQTAAKPAAVPVPVQKTGAAGDAKLEAIEVETAGRHHPSDIVDADVVDVDVVDAEVVESPNVAAPLKRIGRRSGLVLPDPQTDEWPQAQIADTLAAQPPRQPPPAPTPPAQTHGAGAIEVPVARPEPAASAPAADWAPTAISQGTEVEVLPRADLVRPGPSILEADTWTVDPDDTPNSDYHGRRRADTTGRRRLLVAAALALIFVIGSIGVVLLLNSGSTPEATGPGGSTISTDDPLYSDAPVTTTEGELAPASSSPGASLTASAKPTTGVTTSAPAIPGATSTPPAPTPTGPASPPFTPINIQAESGSMTSPSFQREGSQCGSQGDVVRVGRWWNGEEYRVYMLTLNDVTVSTAGTYTMTLHYISSASPSTRTFQLTVNGVPVATPSFQRSTCVTTKSFDVPLNAGSNQLAFTNESDRAPTLDRIVISRP